ncbi:MAG: hypothetical protein ACRDKI_07060 [Solirubrobacterales bacterium]
MSNERSYERLLVIANETIAGSGLHRQIRDMLTEGGKVLVVAPALSSRLKYVFSDVDGPRAQAQERLDRSLELLAASGIRARGEVGDVNPVRAFEDEVALFEPDAVLVSTHPEGRSHWLENHIVEKIEAKTDLPVTHVVVDLTAEEAAARIAAA